MDPKQLKPPDGYLTQLALDLDLEDVDRDSVGFVSPAEAERRSRQARNLLGITGQSAETPGWFEQYQALLDAGWPWRQACYIAWASSPKIGRWPKTQSLLASEVLGLTGPRAIGTWRSKNPAIDEAVSILQAAPLMEHRADVLRALAEAASDRDHRNNPDRKLFLELTGDYVARQRVDLRSQDIDDLSTMSDAELDVLARRVMKKDGADE